MSSLTPETPTPPPIPVVTGGPDEGTTAILHMPDRRVAGEPFSRGELQDIVATTRAFLASANNRSGPGKPVLWSAVKSLLKAGTRQLSKAWDKTQLVSVLLRWSQEAIKLPTQDLQKELTVEILSNRKLTKQLAHNICLLDVKTDTLETFQIDSPSPVLPHQGYINRPQTVASASSSEANSSPSSSASPAASSSSVSPTLNDSFLKDIGELAGEFGLLAAIPANHTPRVSEENFCQETEHVFSKPQGPKEAPAHDGEQGTNHD